MNTVLEVIGLLLKLYRQLGGPKPDLEKLWSEAGEEIKRIDDQQAADEARENEAARRHSER